MKNRKRVSTITEYEDRLWDLGVGSGVESDHRIYATGSAGNPIIFKNEDNFEEKEK